jgi:hypothetical protein
MATQVSFDIEGQSIPVTIGRARLQRLAKHWHYVMRSRRRWIHDAELASIIQERAKRHMIAIGIGQDKLESIASAGLVQVRVELGSTQTTPTSSTDIGWEARLAPWEYMLSAATRKYRNKPLLVVRHLAGLAPHPKPPARGKVLFVQSAPGSLRELYTFESEKRALINHLHPDYELIEVVDPTETSLRKAASDENAAIIHVSGVDNYQGATFIDPQQEEISPEAISDGMYLRDDRWNETPVNASAIASAIASGVTKPSIVSFNLFNSSARLAAHSVYAGASAALGFQDFVDDLLAEVFFANFYWYWRTFNRNLLRAFEKSLSELFEYKDKLDGTGIVLWSASPLLPRAATYDAPESRRNDPKEETVFNTEIRPHERLNYSMLHNGTNQLFESFCIYKNQPGNVKDIEIDVELQIGLERFPFKRTVEMHHHVLELASEIVVGLTSDLSRSIRESIKATLFVKVSHSNRQIFCRTFPITLLPVDEWRDDGVNHIWLPSFVLPRDPAVLDLIIKAQRFLMALRDDAFAGFDGYQQLEGDDPDPDAIDAQVRSLWYAILHDSVVHYINPPPSFSDSSQRLRTPSDTLSGGRGTCIDLALLLASCLEFIEIYPVIILLDGHAFPAYWSSDEARKRFLVSPSPPLEELPDQPTPLPDEEEEPEETESFAVRVPWEFGKSRYGEVLDAVQKGDLVPLESTMLTSRGSFWDAIDEGTNNLDDPNEFYSMLDIRMARDNGITPLPLQTVGRRHHGST